MTSSSTIGSREKTTGTMRPPIPFAVSATTLIGESEPTSTKETTWSANCSSMSRRETVPRAATGAGPVPARAFFAVSRISPRPVSIPTGRAPDRQNLMPLYWAGLCDAVNMAPGMSSVPAAK